MDFVLPSVLRMKTLNGLITEYLEFLPERDYSFRLYGYPMEVIDADDNRLTSVCIYPDKYVNSEESDD